MYVNEVASANSRTTTQFISLIVGAVVTARESKVSSHGIQQKRAQRTGAAASMARRRASWSDKRATSQAYERTQRTGTAAFESLWRDRPGGLTSPALHACGSASPACARCCHSSPIQVVSSPYHAQAHGASLTEYDIASLFMVSREYACARRPGLPQACRSG